MAYHPPCDLGRPVRGRVFKYGDGVNTDVIFPGKYTYTLQRPEEIASHALEDLDPLFAQEVKPGDVIVAGRNWGCGSSREQAVTCLKWSGVAAILALSFSRIFYRNAINQGLLALTCPAAIERLATGDEVTLDLAAGRLTTARGEVPLPPLSPSVRELLKAGGLLAATKQRLRV